MTLEPHNMPKVSRMDYWINRTYFVLLPIILGIALIGLFTTVQTNRQNAEIIKRIKVVSEQTNTLSKDNKLLNTQTKKLGEDNKSINKQNRSFVLCGFQVFAEYTRTRVPIENLNLEACTTDSQTTATDNTPTGGSSSSPSNTSASSRDAPRPQSSTSSQPSSPTNSTPPAPPPQPDILPDCKFDII